MAIDLTDAAIDRLANQKTRSSQTKELAAHIKAFRRVLRDSSRTAEQTILELLKMSSPRKPFHRGKVVKVLFLDIDGVLISKRSIDDYSKKNSPHIGWFAWCTDSTRRLEKLMASIPELHIVLCSPWRLALEDIEDVRDFFATNGCAVLRERIIGRTGESLGSRSDEIELWLSDHQHDYVVTNYVVLESTPLGNGRIKSRLVQTDLCDGLQDRHIEAIQNMLL